MVRGRRVCRPTTPRAIAARCQQGYRLLARDKLSPIRIQNLSGSNQKSEGACSNQSYRWDVLIVGTRPRATAARRPARIVKLIRHAKSTDAAHGCPALLKGEEAAIGATAKPTA